MADEKKEGTMEKDTVGTSNVSSENNGKNNKTIIAIVVGALLILGALTLTGSVDLDGDKTLAIVNGEKITQSEFNIRMDQIVNSPQAQVLNLEDPEIRKTVEGQILQEIINTKLLLGAANDAGFVSTDEEVQTEYDLIVAQLGSEEALNIELEKGGLTNKELMENIASQIEIEQYLESKIDTASIVATEEEVQALYAQIATQEGAPALSEIRPQVEAQISQQKQQAQIGTILEEIRAGADIEILQ